MFKSLQRILALIALFFSCSITQAAIPIDNPTSYLGTTAKGKFSRSIVSKSFPVSAPLDSGLI